MCVGTSESDFRTGIIAASSEMALALSLSASPAKSTAPRAGTSNDPADDGARISGRDFFSFSRFSAPPRHPISVRRCSISALVCVGGGTSRRVGKMRVCKSARIVIERPTGPRRPDARTRCAFSSTVALSVVGRIFFYLLQPVQRSTVFSSLRRDPSRRTKKVCIQRQGP